MKNNITTPSLHAIPVDSDGEHPEPNPYLAAMQTTRMGGMQKKDLRKAVSEILTKCLLDLSLVMATDMQSDLVTGIIDEVGLVFKTCTIGELEMLMRKGVRREYGEFYGLNVAAVNFWLKSFVKSAERVRAIQALMNQPRGPEMTPEEAEAGFIDVVQRDFTFFKQTGRLKIEYPNYLFNWLEGRGILKLTVTEKKKIYETAKGIVKEKKEGIRKTGTLTERNLATGFINRMATDQLTPHDVAELRQEARLMSIRQFYEAITVLIL